jgi:hypothetical protein
MNLLSKIMDPDRRHTNKSVSSFSNYLERKYSWFINSKKNSRKKGSVVYIKSEEGGGVVYFNDSQMPELEIK